MRSALLLTCLALLIASGANAGPITATFGGSSNVSVSVGSILTVDVQGDSMGVQGNSFDLDVRFTESTFPGQIGVATVQSSSVSVDAGWDVAVDCSTQMVPDVQEGSCSVQGTWTQGGVAELQSLTVSITFLYDWAPFEECFVESATCVPAGQIVAIQPDPGDFFGETLGIGATAQTLADILVVIPEPGTGALLLLGCIGLGLRTRGTSRVLL